jgi:predicted dehydrogenase
MIVAIIGCGLIGRKRAISLDTNDKLLACCDTNKDLSEKFASEFSCLPFSDYHELLSQINCDSVIVAVVNKFAGNIIINALKLGKNILAEKPLGRNLSEALEINDAHSKSPFKVILKTGFNHRFHPAIWKAKQLLDDRNIGQVFNIRAIYGHGGRVGMENEWRASKELCGGGELLDQGVHVIDLIRWFGGEITEVCGKVETKFWDMEVEDNAYVILKTQDDVTATFNVSWTNWKNIFSFEIFGTNGYLKIEGLGGSYGPETLELGRRKKEGGKPDIELFEFPPDDISWKEEWKEFKSAIHEKREVIGNGYDGLKANLVIDAIYKSSLSNSVVKLD